MSGHHAHTGGHASEIRTLAQRVENIAERLRDVPLPIAAQYYLAAASEVSGDYRATERVCRNVMPSLPDPRTREGFGPATFPANFSGLSSRAPSPNAACSTKDSLTHKRRSGSPKRSINRPASSWDVSSWRCA